MTNATQPSPTPPARREIERWLAIIAGDGLTDADLFRAAVALRLAVRAERAERAERDRREA